MNETNSTRFSTISRMLAFFVVFFIGTSTISTAQSVCACKGAIQVSVNDACQAAITSDMILTNGLTCGGAATAVVTLMKTPTGNIIATGTGSALLQDAHLYIGKKIYGKVTESTGVNSCWTEIVIEDKLAPVIECPDDLTLTCYQLAAYCPVVTENCSHYTLNMIAETITVNDCRPATGLPDEVLKVITRTYQAVDESGNVSAPCTVNITVEGLPTLNDPYINMPANRWLADDTELQCNEDYAKIPAGQPFAGNPSPFDITSGGKTRRGTGVPYLLLWNPATFNAGVIDGNGPGSITLIGGTDNTLPNTRTLGAEICFNSLDNQTMTFNWSAFMQNNAGVLGGQFLNDEPVYSVNGIETNLPPVVTGVNTGSGLLSVVLEKGDEFCFRVYTMNRANHTHLTISNITSNVPTALPRLYLPIYPTPDLYCNVLVSFSDVKLPEIGCVTKIMRTWQVLEWSCRGTQRIRTHLQMIEIADKVGPTITEPADFTASTNGHSCEANIAFPAALVFDSCSTWTVDITYPGGFIKGVNGGLGKLPVGCHTVTYTAYDACYNSTTATVVVTVVDNTPPVAICDQNTVIGLTLDGKAWVPATSFDDGSYDECELAKMLVRRMNPQACTPCKTPEFPGFTFLGEYVNSGKSTPHYYYISKHRSTPEVAIKTAAAMGGYVVAINTAAENAWVYDQVQQWNLNEDYLIGLRDIKKKGLFSWLSNETSTYRNWAVASPRDVVDGENSYDFVRVLDADARWYDFGTDQCETEEWLYVIEITDPCGFSSYAQFCCSDVGTTPHMVQFRVIDKAGNWNDCMVNAIVQDKLPPAITCPSHMTVTCEDIFDLTKLRAAFGWPTVYDNCENPRVVTDSIIDLNSCRIGTITRRFVATDAGGRTASCTQIITIEGSDDPFEMTLDRWPADRTISDCADPNSPVFGPDRLGRPNLLADNTCSLVGSEYTDQIFTFNNSTGEACFKILRHWTVIDWCQRYEITPGGGYAYRTWEHTQVIKVNDPVKPVITSSCARKSVCTYDPGCTDGYIELIATGTDVCTDILRWSYKIDAFNNGSFDLGLSNTGLGNTADASERYPIGNHRIQWSFEDRCGNITTCDQLFDIVNCKAPTPYCLNGLATSLMPIDTDNDGTPDVGMIDIWAKDFDNGSSHPCGYEVILSFEPVTLDANGKPVVKDSLIFTCADLGRVDLDLYAAVITPMGTVVQDYCSTFINIQDNNEVCEDDGRRFAINGSAMTESAEPVKDVFVKLEGSEMNAMTNVQGIYSFGNMPIGGSYTVSPSKNDDILNGVTTLDLVMMQRHILGIQKLTSPYKMIAADVNKDKNITAADLVELRKVILGVNTKFSNNESWRFVDKSHTFGDTQFALSELFSEKTSVDNINADMIVDFTSIKVGDVNESAAANVNSNNIESRSGQSLTLTTENQTFEAGQIVTIPVNVAENADVTGFQFTVNFDTELFSLEAVNGGIIGMTDQNFGFAKLADGIVTLSFNKEKAMNLVEGANVFTLTLKAKDKGLVSQGLWVDSSLTPAEAYTNDNDVMKVAFNVSGRTEAATVLYQNTPNPFKAITVIGFDLPEAMDAKVTIYDVTGRVVKVINNTFVKGYNSVELNKNELGSVGVLYYTLEAGDFKATRKMVVID